MGWKTGSIVLFNAWYSDTAIRIKKFARTAVLAVGNTRFAPLVVEFCRTKKELLAILIEPFVVLRAISRPFLFLLSADVFRQNSSFFGPTRDNTINTNYSLDKLPDEAILDCCQSVRSNSPLI